ncbi:DUF3037 domain-containing protein [Anaerolineales bacterium HSG25]|nr:DUF3037 domain-containing protein [Anaerolineales bacterium HSG25]
MPKPSTYDYALIRVVPQVERGEFVNAGVILFCRTQRFLGVQIDLNQSRLLALAPACNLARIEAQLAIFEQICAGHGPIGALDLADRFHWLVAPRSTIIQFSPVHCGLGTDPQIALEQLLERLVCA